MPGILSSVVVRRGTLMCQPCHHSLICFFVKKDFEMYYEGAYQYKLNNVTFLGQSFWPGFPRGNGHNILEKNGQPLARIIPLQIRFWKHLQYYMSTISENALGWNNFNLKPLFDKLFHGRAHKKITNFQIYLLWNLLGIDNFSSTVVNWWLSKYIFGHCIEIIWHDFL